MSNLQHVFFATKVCTYCIFDKLGQHNTYQWGVFVDCLVVAMVSHAGAAEGGGSGGKLVPPDFVRSKITVLQICMHRGFWKFTKFWLNISGPNYVSNSTHIQQGLGFPNTLT